MTVRGEHDVNVVVGAAPVHGETPISKVATTTSLHASQVSAVRGTATARIEVARSRLAPRTRSRQLSSAIGRQQRDPRVIVRGSGRLRGPRSWGGGLLAGLGEGAHDERNHP